MANQQIVGIDYSVWGQYAVAETVCGNLPGKEAFAIQVRLPFGSVKEGRRSFSRQDLIPFNPHINLGEQSYQLHLFGKSGDSYINIVPFEKVLAVLWYFHQNPDSAHQMICDGESKTFHDFTRHHLIAQGTSQNDMVREGLGLRLCNEKYGMFSVEPEGTFFSKQFHRLALFGALLQLVGYSEDYIRAQIESAVKKNGENSEFCFLSEAEALSFVDEGGERFSSCELNVCRDHGCPPLYWTGQKTVAFGWPLFRLINPDDPKKERIEQLVESVPERTCPLPHPDKDVSKLLF